MNENRKRSTWRISLRMVFVAMTVLCCWLAWQLNTVHQRQVHLKQLRAMPAFHVTTADAWAAQYPNGNPVQTQAKISRVRRLLGDEAIQEIWYPWHEAPSAEELTLIGRRFPEAELRETLPEPCHPGCFPRGTIVETDEGQRPIETLVVGDRPITFVSSGTVAVAQVQSIFVTDNRFWKVETDDGELITTQTQPLCVSLTEVRQVGNLRPGDKILRQQGQTLRSVTVLKVSQTTKSGKVYNVILGDSEIFVANGFLARSKPPEARED